MSIKFMNAVWESDIGPVNKRMVLLALADNANDAGLCKPGVAYLVGKAEVARSTVFRVLKELESEGLLQRAERRRENGSRRSNAYRLNLPAIQARHRVVTKEERDELEALFDDVTDILSDDEDEPDNEHEAAGRAHSPGAGPCETPGRAHSPGAGRGVVPERDGGSPGAGRAGGPTAGPLEPPVEPPEEPPTAGPARSASRTTSRASLAAAAGIAPLRSAIPLPSNTVDDFATGPDSNSIGKRNHLTARARATSRRRKR